MSTAVSALMAPQSSARFAETAAADMPDLQQLQAFLRPGSHLLVTSHARPDGDAVGSVLAMGNLLRQRNITVDLVLTDPVPEVYRNLPGVEQIRIVRTVDVARYDGAVVLECDGVLRSGLSGLAALPIFNLDHHITGTPYGSLNWIDWNACAVAVLVYRLAAALQLEITPATATCLYTAVLTDTGAFTYPGTASHSFSIANELIALGADADSVARDVLYSVSAAHIRLLGIALSRMQVHGTVVWSYVTQADLASTGATDEDSENTVTHLISIAGVHAALFLRELPFQPDAPPRFRVSLRSKSQLDVSAVAATCGGGGHRTAAGCVLAGDLHTIAAAVLRQIDSELLRHGIAAR